MDPAAGPQTWHVYGVDWTASEMVFTIDGREVYRATKAQIERYGPWAFDNRKYLILNFALGGSYPQSVNKAETPYPGLPASTVEQIKQDSTVPRRLGPRPRTVTTRGMARACHPVSAVHGKVRRDDDQGCYDR